MGTDDWHNNTLYYLGFGCLEILEKTRKRKWKESITPCIKHLADSINIEYNSNKQT